MVDIKQIVDSKKIPQFADKIEKYIKEHEEMFKLLDIDFKQFFFDGYLKNQGYIESETKITVDYRVVRLLWFHYCETYDVLNDKNKTYRITVNLLENLIKTFANSNYEWRKDYSIRIEHIYKNSNLFPTGIDYKLTIYYILNKLKRCILPLIHQLKVDRAEYNDRPKRKYNDYNYDYDNENESNYRNNYNNNNLSNKRDKKDIVEVKVNNGSIISPDSDYFTFLATDNNPGLAHKQYLNCIESAYYYFKTMHHNPGQSYFEKLSNTEDPDKFHNDNITKLQSIYNNYQRSNSNTSKSTTISTTPNETSHIIPNHIVTNIPSPLKQSQPLPPPYQQYQQYQQYPHVQLQPQYSQYSQYSQYYNQNQNQSPSPSPSNIGNVLRSSPAHFNQYNLNQSPNLNHGPSHNYRQTPSPTTTNGYIPQSSNQYYHNTNSNQQTGPKEWCEWFELQDKNLKNTSQISSVEKK